MPQIRGGHGAQFQTRGDSYLNCKHVYTRRISSTVPAIAMALAITVSARDSEHSRSPRTLFNREAGRIGPATIAEAGTNADPNMAQGPGPGPIGPGPGCNLFPAPASIGTSIGLSYFGPPPSTSNQSLVGPVQLLKSGQVDVAKGTITLPLYLGHMKDGRNVWYILSDVDDAEVAELLGLNFSAKMSYMSRAARTANFDQTGDLVFDKGTVDFSPARLVVPGPPGHEFPPSQAQSGAVGDSDYNPYVQVVNAAGVIYNAPIVAFGVMRVAKAANGAGLSSNAT